MRLQEYQAKSLLRNAGIPVPSSMLANNVVQVKRIASEIGYPVVLKAQTMKPGRGKSGGVRLVQSEQDLENVSTEMFGLVFDKYPVQSILVEKAFTFSKEYYLGIRTDFDLGCPVLRISEAGGATCLEAESFMNAPLSEQAIDINRGLKTFEIRNLLAQIDIDSSLWKQFISISLKLYNLFCLKDASLIELNSLVVTHQQQLFALDAKVTIDDKSIFRQDQFVNTFDPSFFSDTERQAMKYDVNYLRFPGELGCVVNGIGLAYLTIDHLIRMKNVPAAITDIHGGATITSIVFSMETLFRDDRVHAIMVNIFGGMTDCEVVADGIISSIKYNDQKKPVFIRLKGTNHQIAIDRLSLHENIRFFDTTESLTQAALDSLKEGLA
mgnify:FL=1